MGGRFVIAAVATVDVADRNRRELFGREIERGHGDGVERAAERVEVDQLLRLGEGTMSAFLLPEMCRRLPFLLGCSPSPPSMTPALTSSSLNLPISVMVFSSGITPASDSFVALTIIMTFIALFSGV